MTTNDANDSDHSNPARDRALAARPRHGFRNAVGIEAMAQQFLKSQSMRDAKRFQRVIGVLRRELGPELAQHVTPHALRAGTLTLVVADSILLAELRNHLHHNILEACVVAGAGVTEIIYRVARR